MPINEIPIQHTATHFLFKFSYEKKYRRCRIKSTCTLENLYKLSCKIKGFTWRQINLSILSKNLLLTHKGNHCRKQFLKWGNYTSKFIPINPWTVINIAPFHSQKCPGLDDKWHSYSVSKKHPCPGLYSQLWRVTAIHRQQTGIHHPPKDFTKCISLHFEGDTWKL